MDINVTGLITILVTYTVLFVTLYLIYNKKEKIANNLVCAVLTISLYMQKKFNLTDTETKKLTKFLIDIIQNLDKVEDKDIIKDKEEIKKEIEEIIKESALKNEFVLILDNEKYEIREFLIDLMLNILIGNNYNM